MKKLLFSIATLLMAGVAGAQANQPDYYFEFGLYGGIAPFSKPNLSYDKGTNNVLPAIWGANLHYNINDRWQIGLDANISRWKGTGSTLLHGLFDTTLGTASTTYVYADRAIATTIRANYVIPHYDEHHLNRSNFYFGLAGGFIVTVNDGSMAYAQFQDAKGEQYRYVSQYNYDAQGGYTFGVQAGWNYYFTNNIGFNADFAPRFSHLSGVDNRAGSRNGMYEVYTFPITIGFRFRF